MPDVIEFKPYMMHCTQDLYDENMDLRVIVAERLRLIFEVKQRKVKFISDRSCFYVSRLMNKHKCRIWSANNHHFTVKTTMNSAKVNVLCGLSKKIQIIYPYLFVDETDKQHN